MADPWFVEIDPSGPLGLRWWVRVVGPGCHPCFLEALERRAPGARAWTEKTGGHTVHVRTLPTGGQVRVGGSGDDVQIVHADGATPGDCEATARIVEEAIHHALCCAGSCGRAVGLGTPGPGPA